MEKIPSNLEEAFEIFDANKDEHTEKWAAEPEDRCMFGIHHGPGTSLRNSWGLWGVGDDKTEIYKWFNSIGIAMGDDLSSIIYTSYHRYLNGKPIDLHGQVKEYWAHWTEYDSKQYLPPAIEGCSQEYLDLYEEFKKENT